MEDTRLQPSTLEPSPQSTTEWIGWHVKQVNMMAWWQELQEVPGQDDIQEFARKGAGIISTTKGEMPCHQSGEQLLCPTSTPLPGQGPFPAHPGYAVWWPGLLTEAATQVPGLCKGPPALGRKSPDTNPRQTLLTGRKCAGALM